MSVKGMAASAAEMVGANIVEKSANKAMRSLPEPKQNKIRGFLMLAGAIMLLVSGLKLVRKAKNANYVNNA
jgi:hypothetical protein